MPFTVVVADNFYYMDESENYELGSFSTLELAIAASQQIVDDYLTSTHCPGSKAEDLFMLYTMFGEDPYIVAQSDERITFSAWEYAKAKCEEMCAPDA